MPRKRTKIKKVKEMGGRGEEKGVDFSNMSRVGLDSLKTHLLIVRKKRRTSEWKIATRALIRLFP